MLVTPDHQRIIMNRTMMREQQLDLLVCSLPTQVLLVSGYWPITGYSLPILRSTDHPEPNTNAKSATAQPAGAKMAPNKKTAAEADTILIPTNASKTIQTLGNSIQKCSTGMSKPAGKA